MTRRSSRIHPSSALRERQPENLRCRQRNGYQLASNTAGHEWHRSTSSKPRCVSGLSASERPRARSQSGYGTTVAIAAGEEGGQDATGGDRRGCADEYGGRGNGDGFADWSTCCLCRPSLAAQASARKSGKPLIKNSPVRATLLATIEPGRRWTAQRPAVAEN